MLQQMNAPAPSASEPARVVIVGPARDGACRAQSLLTCGGVVATARLMPDFAAWQRAQELVRPLGAA